MRDVYDFAKYFMKIGADSKPNTYDGNMKLQKLLVMAYVICLALYSTRLFEEDILAFRNGCVVEKVRLRYKLAYQEFKKDSDLYQPNFSEQEYKVLGLVTGIFGDMSAVELSRFNHVFDFWKKSYENGTDVNGYHVKDDSVVDFSKYPEDLQTMRDIVAAYQEGKADDDVPELINGVKFYHEGLVLTDDIIDKLATFAETAEDSAYSVYMDCGELVIY